MGQSSLEFVIVTSGINKKLLIVATQLKSEFLNMPGIANRITAINRVKNQYRGTTRLMRLTMNFLGVSVALEIYTMMKPDITKKISTPKAPVFDRYCRYSPFWMTA